jgi:hypothetical protein
LSGFLPGRWSDWCWAHATHGCPRITFVRASNAEGVSAESIDEGYLTDRELAAKLKWSTKTLEKKVRHGIFTQDVHYFQRPGMRRRWKWSAVVRWLENGDEDVVATAIVPLAGIARGRAGR